MRPGPMPIIGTLLIALALTGPAVAEDGPYLVVLGIAQDGGVPQLGDENHPAWSNPGQRRLAASLALVDPAGGGRWLFDATPDLRRQLHALHRAAPRSDRPGLDGIFLTHAHMGHYTGLMFLGHESLGAQAVPVYAMPRMRAYLTENGPWDQLVRYRNIELRPLDANTPVPIANGISVTPLPVPHRQEYSEVVGYRIQGPNRSALFLPDIDSWEAWRANGVDLIDVLAGVDVAFIDATFYADGEVAGRDMSGFPHPRIVETMALLEDHDPGLRQRVRFIHLNHTNPALRAHSPERQAIEAAGFAVAREGERVTL